MERYSKFFTIIALTLSMSASAVDEASANINKGNIHIGGSATLSTASYSNSNSSNQISLNPFIGYFIADRFSLGFVTGFTQSSSNTPSGGDKNTTSFNLGPSARYYFWHQEKFASNVTGAFNINTYSPGDYSYWRATLSIGLEYFLLPSVAIGPGFLYRHQFKTDKVPDMNEFVLFGGLAIFI